MKQESPIELEAVGRCLGLQICPAVALRQLTLGVGLLGHLEKEQISQLGNVLVIGHPVVAQYVAQVPELLADVMSDCSSHDSPDLQAAGGHISSLKRDSTWVSSPSKTLFSLAKPPPCWRNSCALSSSASRSTMVFALVCSAMS